MTTKQVQVATPPYMPPYARERAWGDDDEWSVVGMRDGFTMALDAGVQMEERKPDTLKNVGGDRVRWRSNRIAGVGSIDQDIVDRVMAMEDAEVEEVARWRRDHAEEIGNHPRLVLDAFANDIVWAVEDAGQWDKAAAERWQAHREAVAAPAARWLGDRA